MEPVSDTLSNQFRCNHCNKDVSVRLVSKGPHVGIYCAECARYIKWASQEEKDLLTCCGHKVEGIMEGYNEIK